MLIDERDSQFTVADINPYHRAFAEVAGEQRTADSRLQLVRQVSTQGPGVVPRVIAMLGDQPAGIFGEFEHRAALGQPAPEVGDLEIDDLFNLGQGQAAEENDVVDPVEELWPEVCP